MPALNKEECLTFFSTALLLPLKLKSEHGKNRKSYFYAVLGNNDAAG